MGVKQCELCDRPARMHCESDQASLCWECDAKVHGANFLVARHSRCLLCRSCQSPTPWRAEGVRLGPTVSVCERCAAHEGRKASDGGDFGEEGEGGGRDMDEDAEEEDEEDEGEEEDEDEEDGEEEDQDDEGENQVVPWSTTPPPPVASSSSSEEEEPGRTWNGGGFLKRMRENADLAVSQEDLVCSSNPSCLASPPAPAAGDGATSFAAAFRPYKDRKRPALLRPASTDARVQGNR